MLTPTIVPAVRPFYAIGNSPALNLTRCLPQGLDADILLLGCGDVRHVLCTAYHEHGFPRRKIDVTCCDYEDSIIARNVLFYTFLLDDEPVSSDVLWNIYYDLYLDEPAMRIVQTQVAKLLALGDTLEAWHDSKYGKALRFCDEETFSSSVRAMLVKFGESVAARTSAEYRRAFSATMDQAEVMKKKAWGDVVFVYAHIKAAGPFSPKLMGELTALMSRYWRTGLTDEAPASAELFPNPLFAACVSENLVRAWPSEPLGTYYLAPAYAELTELSPLRPDSRDPSLSLSLSLSQKIVATARLQFRKWTDAFRELSPNIVVRFSTADCFALCRTLQHNVGTGETCAHWYRRQMCFKPLRLADSEYGKQGRAPRQFDVIDTSNLSDYHGSLNLLVEAGPLLKDAPWSTLYTELMARGSSSEKHKFETLLGGNTRTVSMLLGLAPVEYWTNARAVSFVDECMVSVAVDPTGTQTPRIQSFLEWRREEYLSSLSTHASPVQWSYHIADAATTAVEVYNHMFSHESLPDLRGTPSERQQAEVTKHFSASSYVKYHRGNFISFLSAVCRRRNLDFYDTADEVYEIVDEDGSLMLGRNHLQALLVAMTERDEYVLDNTKDNNKKRSNPSLPGFCRWKAIPEVIAITLVVPSAKWRKVYNKAFEAEVGLPVEVRLESPGSNNIFSEVQVGYGTVTTRGSPDDDEYTVFVEAGGPDSSLIATFYVLSDSLERQSAGTVALCMQLTAQNVYTFGRLDLEDTMAVHRVPIMDQDSVFISKLAPHQTSRGVVSGPSSSGIRDLTLNESKPGPKITGDLELFRAEIGFTGRVDITSEQGKQLLADKVPIKLRQSTAFTIDIVFGKKALVMPVTFPLPVDKDRCRTRIARKSSYIELVAQVADPAAFTPALDDFMFPTTLAHGPPSSSSSTGFFPVTLNLPHVNLDALPILSLADTERLGTLVNFTSHIFSLREREARTAIQASRRDGLSSTSGRLNFKESIFTIFMLATGLQGGQTGLFMLSHPQRGGVHILLFVSAVRLDGAGAGAGSIVLDAAVLPLTEGILQDPDLKAFLALLQTSECCRTTVDDAELVLWKRMLPALAERCRNWEHGPACEYYASGDETTPPTIPLSLEPGKPVLCSCGRGKFPAGFIGVPGWEAAAPHATRIAISPVFASPVVEEVFDRRVFAQVRAMSMAKVVAKGRGKGKGKGKAKEGKGKGEMDAKEADDAEEDAEEDGSSAAAIPIDLPTGPTCLNCGATEAHNGGPLRKCTRCLKALYCSPGCQKKDWRKHRPECQEAEEHQQQK